MPLQTHIANEVLDAILRNDTWTAGAALFASLHSTTLALSVTSGGAGEVTGGSYLRQELAFGAGSSGESANTGAVEFTTMPATTVYTFAINTSSSEGGNLIWQNTLTASKTVGAGDTLRFAIGAILGVST